MLKEKQLEELLKDKDVIFLLKDILKLKNSKQECEIKLYWKNGKQYNKKYTVRKLIE